MMRILLITDEVWNDNVHANGVLSNWFKGFEAEFAQIYCSPGLPYNSVCSRYFQVTDGQMVKSVILGRRAGHIVQIADVPMNEVAVKNNPQRQGVYGFFKKVSLRCHMPVMILRDIIWRVGRYDIGALKDFVNDFKPDIVYCPRLATYKLIRLEKMISRMTDAPFVAFTADDEVSLSQVSYNPLFWIRRLSFRRVFKQHVGIYKHYFTFSQEQSSDYVREFGVPSDTLYKCGDFADTFVPKMVGTPIRIVYAGRLYCNRWKTLEEIGKALRIINAAGIKVVLDVYTTEELTEKQKKVLVEDNYIYMKGSVPAEELINVYKNSDIALHVESLDRKYRQDTKVSFSTKIIDLMNSSCAIMAICWNQHTGYQYLHDNDAAVCIDSYDGILPTIQKIVDNPEIIKEYGEKAYNCGIKNHNREKIQKQILDKFNEIIYNGK